MMKNMKLVLLALALLVSAPVALFAAEEGPVESTTVKGLAKAIYDAINDPEEEDRWTPMDLLNEDLLTENEVQLIVDDEDGFVNAYMALSGGKPMPVGHAKSIFTRVKKYNAQAAGKALKDLAEGKAATEEMPYIGGMFEETVSAPAMKKAASMSGYTMADVNAIQPSRGVFNVSQIRQLRQIFDAAVAAGDKSLAKAAMDQASKSTSQTGVASMRAIYNRM